MGKILDKEFRTELYKNLVDAGYEKNEATSIVSVKYRDALKERVMGIINEQVESINTEKYECIINQEELTNLLAELKKLADFFKKIEKS